LIISWKNILVNIKIIYKYKTFIYHEEKKTGLHTNVLKAELLASAKSFR